jgi:hypothetical protein
VSVDVPRGSLPRPAEDPREPGIERVSSDNHGQQKRALTSGFSALTRCDGTCSPAFTRQRPLVRDQYRPPETSRSEAPPRAGPLRARGNVTRA